MALKRHRIHSIKVQQSWHRPAFKKWVHCSQAGRGEDIDILKRHL